MTRKEIEAAWGQSQSKSRTVHNRFPQEMAKRTVINRAAKNFINTSDDSDILVDAINRTTGNEYDNDRIDVTPEQEAQQEIEQNANTEELDFSDDNIEDAEFEEIEPDKNATATQPKVEQHQHTNGPVQQEMFDGPDF